MATLANLMRRITPFEDLGLSHRTQPLDFATILRRGVLLVFEREKVWLGGIGGGVGGEV